MLPREKADQHGVVRDAPDAAAASLGRQHTYYTFDHHPAAAAYICIYVYIPY